MTLIIQTLVVTHPEDEIKEKQQVFDTFCSSFYSHGAFHIGPENKMKVKTHKRKYLRPHLLPLIPARLKHAGTI